MIKSVEIKENVFLAATLDYDIKVFDIVMYTKYGTTYNSYIIKGKDKVALIDIAKETFFDQFIEIVKQVCDPKDIDYVVVNHTEPDHSGSLAGLLKINPELEIIGSNTAIKFLRDITNMKYKERVVNDGDSLDLGGKTLKFINAPFLHWPDSMYTYCPEDKTLYTCDSFGCHYCTDKAYSDLVEQVEYWDSFKYYFDVIMGPFKTYILQALDKIKDLDIDLICPGHGPIIREDLPKYINLYKEWSTETIPAKPSIVIPYVSAYGYTKKLAVKIVEGLKSVGDFEIGIYDLVGDKLPDVMKKVSTADGIIIGSPTIVGDTLPPIWALLSELNPVIHKGKIAGAFGSYGWSGEAIPNIEGRMKQLRIKMPVESLKVMFNPDEEKLQKAFEFGEKFGLEVDKLFKSKYNK